MSDTGPTAARRPSLRAKLRTGRATRRKPRLTTRPTRSGRAWNLEPPRGSTNVVTRLIVANTTTSKPRTKPIQTMGLVSYTIKSASARGAGAARARARRRPFQLGRPGLASATSPLSGSSSGLGPLPPRRGRTRNGARRSTQPRFSRPARRTRRAPRSRLRAIPASMSVSRTWRCDIRNRVMTGTLAVVNKRVVPPTVAPQETTRPKRPCASSAMRIRCSLVSSRNRSIRASSAVVAAPAVAPWSSSTALSGADDEDLVVVDGHLWNPDVEVVRKPAREPGLDLRSLLGGGTLLGSRSPTGPAPTGGRDRAVPRAGEGHVDAHEMSWT